MNFIKKWSWLILGILTVAILAGGLNFGYNLMRARAFAQAKGQYEAKIAAAESAKIAALAEKARLSENAGKDREDARLRAEAEKRKADNVFAIFKSETAEKLKARDATISEVLAEKEKDEIVITEAREIIGTIYIENKTIREAWALSDERIEAANKEAMDALTLQFQTCTTWSAVLEKRLKPTFLGRLKEVGKYALAFTAGRLSAKI